MQYKTLLLIFTFISSHIFNRGCQCPTEVIVLQEAEVSNVFPHRDLLYSALVEGKLLGHVNVTGRNTQRRPQ